MCSDYTFNTFETNCAKSFSVVSISRGFLELYISWELNLEMQHFVTTLEWSKSPSFLECPVFSSFQFFSDALK